MCGRRPQPPLLDPARLLARLSSLSWIFPVKMCMIPIGPHAALAFSLVSTVLATPKCGICTRTPRSRLFGLLPLVALAAHCLAAQQGCVGGAGRPTLATSGINGVFTVFEVGKGRGLGGPAKEVPAEEWQGMKRLIGKLEQKNRAA